MRSPLLLTAVATFAVVAAACTSPNGGTAIATHSPPPRPVLSALSPTSGQVGSVITASGSGFGGNPSLLSVTVGGAQATVLAVSSGTVSFSIPSAAFPGSRNVEVITAGGSSGALALTVHLAPAVYVQAHGGVPGDPSNDHVFGFSIGSGGNLEPLPGSPWSTGSSAQQWVGNAQSIAIDAPHRRMFVSSKTAVTAFAIDGATGHLAPGAPVGVGDTGMASVALGPNATQLYVLSSASAQLAAFDLASNGDLTAVGGSPFPLGITNSGGDGLAVTPNGHLYAGDGPAFVGFSTGGLAPLLNTPFILSTSSAVAVDLQLDPAGDHLFVPDTANGKLYVFTLENNGNAVPSAASPIPVMPGINALTFSPDGSHLYVGSVTTGQVLEFTVDGTSLTPTFSAPVAQTPGTTDAFAITADGSTFYLLDGTRAEVQVFAIGSAGALIALPFQIPIDATPLGHLAAIRVVP